MEKDESASAVLQNLQTKLEFLEEKANYAKHLMEKAALLSILKFGTDDPEKYQNQIQDLRTEEIQLQSQIAEKQGQGSADENPEIELLRQKEQLLHALVGCISDLEGLDMSIDQDRATTHANKDPNEQLNKQRDMLIQELEKQNIAIDANNEGISQKLEATKDIFSQLDAEKSSFEQTLAGLEALLQHKLSLPGNLEVNKSLPRAQIEMANEDLNSVAVPNGTDSASQQDADKVVLESSKNIVQGDIVSMLQEQIKGLQYTIDNLHEVAKLEDQAYSIKK